MPYLDPITEHNVVLEIIKGLKNFSDQTQYTQGLIVKQ